MPGRLCLLQLPHAFTHRNLVFMPTGGKHACPGFPANPARDLHETGYGRILQMSYAAPKPNRVSTHHIHAGTPLFRKACGPSFLPETQAVSCAPLFSQLHRLRSLIVEFVEFLCIVTLGLLVAQFAAAIGRRISGNE